MDNIRTKDVHNAKKTQPNSKRAHNKNQHEARGCGPDIKTISIRIIESIQWFCSSEQRLEIKPDPVGSILAVTAYSYAVLPVSSDENAAIVLATEAALVLGLDKPSVSS